MNNLKQVTLACHSCFDAYKRMPPAFDKFGPSKIPASIHVYLLPFMEQDPLFKEYLEAEGKGDVNKAEVGPFISSIDPSAKKDGAGVQNFAANLRVFSTKGSKTKFDENMPALAAVEPGTGSLLVPDGTSNTVAFATKYGSCGTDGGSRYASPPNTKSAAFFGQNAAKKRADPADPTATFQLRPGPKQCLTTPLMAQSFLEQALQVSLLDGSARNVSSKVSPATWNYAVQPNDGMALGADW
jgi:hypothetical protein